MKLAKKLASLTLALVMILALSVPALAAAPEGETPTAGTITIDNAVVDETYTIYEVLKLESYNAESNAYAYKATEAWTDFINSPAIKDVYVDVDDQGYVTWHKEADGNDADVVKFAELAKEYAQTLTTNQGSTKATTTTVKFENVELGYYLMDSTLGVLCSLDTTNPDVTIKEKNSQPTLDKEVQEDYDESWGKVNDADIGQTVNFKATITVQGAAKDYVMHDKMDDGLTYVGVTRVTKNDKVVDASNYQVKTNVEHLKEDGTTYTDTFDVVFTAEFCENLTTGDVIVVEYAATLNENAVVAEPENNTARLEYKDNNEVQYTPDSTTKTYTWKVDILKYTNKNENDTTTEVKLAGAKFQLSTDEAGTKVLKFKKATDENDTEIANTYVYDENGIIVDFTTDETGALNFKGLDEGTYYLTEIEAPDGYNKLAHPIKVEVKHTVVQPSGDQTETTMTGSVVYYDYDKDNYSETGTTVGDATENAIKVLNNSGTELPSTGGIGTTIFYAVGGVLVLAAVILLVAKKRMAR